VIYPSLGNGLDNSTSTLVRLHAWYVSFQRFSASSLSEKLLGSVTASGLHVRPGQDLTRYLPFSIDNLLISQSLYFGLMALIPSLFFIWKAWRFLLSRAINDGSPFEIAAAGFGSTIFLLGMYNNGSSVWTSIVLISALCVRAPESARIP